MSDDAPDPEDVWQHCRGCQQQYLSAYIDEDGLCYNCRGEDSNEENSD